MLQVIYSHLNAWHAHTGHRGYHDSTHTDAACLRRLPVQPAALLIAVVVHVLHKSKFGNASWYLQRLQVRLCV